MKRISSGTVTVFVLAIVVGLVAAFVVKQALQPKPQVVAAKPKEQTIPMVVATRNLTENAVVRAGDVRIVQIPVSRKREGALRVAKQAEGRLVKETVKAGTPLLEDNLYAIGETLPGLESRIPVGMRAMPINVDEQSIVAKMVSIGSRVDIALTVEGDHPDLGGLATKTLLHGVQVIGVEKPSTSRRGSSSNNKATITVAVAPADANMLINAEGTGTLDLTLCSPNDGDEVPVSIGGHDHRITKNELLGLKPIPAPPAPPKPFTIEKWEGGSAKIITIPQERVEEAHRATAASKKFGGEHSVPVKTDAGAVKHVDPAVSTTLIEAVPVSTEIHQ